MVLRGRGKSNPRDSFRLWIGWRQAILAATTAAAVLLGGGSPVGAHRRDFPFSYDWMQAAQGEHEIELHSLYQPADSSFEQQFEFEYGVTPRFMVAPYLVFAKSSDESLHYDAFKLETRYQLGTYSPGRVLPGLYLEYEKPHDESSEIEGKLILSRYSRGGDDISLNLITERSLGEGGGMRYTYSLGYARPLATWRQLRGGVEWVRDIDDGQINAGPVVALSPTRRTWAVLSLGLPVNHSGSNGSEFRALLEYEWF